MGHIKPTWTPQCYNGQGWYCRPCPITRIPSSKVLFLRRIVSSNESFPFLILAHREKVVVADQVAGNRRRGVGALTEPDKESCFSDSLVDGQKTFERLIARDQLLAQFLGHLWHLLRSVDLWVRNCVSDAPGGGILAVPFPEIYTWKRNGWVIIESCTWDLACWLGFCI